MFNVTVLGPLGAQQMKCSSRPGLGENGLSGPGQRREPALRLLGETGPHFRSPGSAPTPGARAARGE